MPSSLHIGAILPEVSSQKQEKKSAASGNAASLMTTINNYLARLSGIKAGEKATFFRLLATMINAGISIVKALKILAQQFKNPRLKQTALELAEKIETGRSLSQAMADYDGIFDEAQRGMVESGEASGKLNQILLQLATQTERSSALLSQIRGAMIYPATVVCIMAGAGIAVMTFVMPKIKEMFASMGGELPAATQLLIKISDFLVASTLGLSNVIWGLLGVAGLVAGFIAFKKTELGKDVWAQVVLHFPVAGSLMRKVSLAQFCRSMATLTSSGLSIIKVLKITSGSISNRVYQKRILKIADDVRQGIPMGENMRDDPLFPGMVVGMISVAEQTAQIDTISEKLADFYEAEVNDTVKNLSSLIEPIIIVVLGLAVAFLVISVMMPILQSSDLAGNAA
ncbi:type II secretion system F family protein [Candidatus Peregrinibacteria bacterium]|nr:type II secretion system F family protein [Candidatus Peregrinibacteria bacterium]